MPILSHVPHKFFDGGSIDPSKVNENVLAIMDAARKIMAYRYNHFSVVLPLGTLAQSDGDGEARIPIRTDFSCEVVMAELVVTPVSGGSGIETIELSSTISGWRNASMSVDFSSASENREVVAQSVDIPADTTVYFDFTKPSTVGNEYVGYAVLHCRSDSGVVSLPDPPQARDGETYDTTEFDSWYSSMSSALNSIVSALEDRKVFSVISTGKDVAVGTVPSGEKGHFRLNKTLSGYKTSGRVFHLSDTTATYTGDLRDVTNAVDCLSGNGSVGLGSGASDWVDDGAMVLTDPDAAGNLEYQATVSGSSGLTYRAYATICAKQVA